MRPIRFRIRGIGLDSENNMRNKSPNSSRRASLLKLALGPRQL